MSALTMSLPCRFDVTVNTDSDDQCTREDLRKALLEAVKALDASELDDLWDAKEDVDDVDETDDAPNDERAGDFE